MNHSHAKNAEPFYKPRTSAKKTSAEIINEARNSLRTLRTQRPFTPREDQRKLFGPTSSRTSDNRPPSAFSLHSCSFESPDSRPVSGARLNPLPHKPKLHMTSAFDSHKDNVPCIPIPPMHPMQAGMSRPWLLRATSHGNLPENMVSPQEGTNQQHTSLALKGNLPEDFLGATSHYPEPRQISKIGIINQTSERPCERSSKHKHGPNGSESRPSSCPSRTSSPLLGSNSGSEPEATEADEETRFWDEKICPIVQDLNTAHYEKNLDDLCSLCVKLHKVLEEENMLGKRCKWRVVLLKTLFKLVDLGSDKLGIILAKLILSLKVSGRNLLNICKLIFKISRSENNDCLFQNDEIIDSLLEILQSEDVQTNSEAFLYCMGSIKFLSGNTAILNDLLRKQAVEILVKLMKEVTRSSKFAETASANMSHLLVQVTATLRNLADLSQSRVKFLASNALPELCTLLEHYVWDKDICTNVSRILSKLSVYNDCCMALADCLQCYSLFLSVLNNHPEKQDLVVRIVFTLGNLTAKNNKTREMFYEEQGSIKTILRLLHVYYELDIKASQSIAIQQEKTMELKKPSETEDVLIKLIRALANLCIHPTVGAELAANRDCIALLMQILEYKSIDECEELVINTAATVNNLSFYQDDTSVITKKKLEISKLLFKLLLCNNMDGILEAARVFGNLSRYQDVRSFMMEKDVYKFFVALLDSKHQEVCFSACGVLINLTAEHSNRVLLQEEGAVEKMIDCLRDFASSDWQLAGLLCQALWNFHENLEYAEPCFAAQEAVSLLELLAYLLDEQTALDNRLNEELTEYHKACWEVEFKPVAFQLLERLKRHHSCLEPLPSPV
ncbi:hypothetical protein XENTR_v10014105 [Xenopus tropicalis]|uniref:Armadillo repeat-containing 2 n=1 Tax=Xenopus tropicalis TaxID=8364 RepID=A0A7D9N0K5_XENTR|nr:armadillo repeat-containing protein 2 [Xenopus tropicalis]KAE8602744.1 hypothetical protein XENTR_v10014105 [Xenopus tropicalis]|eukprot:XP_002940593.2 PREDICTED: armadillo repeat-containing protein 2 [Xenopus tropicalis]